MALHNYLRDPQTLAFNNQTLLNNITPQGQPRREPASVLLRTVALYALTHRENENGINTPEHLKVFSKYDCLFPFIHDGLPFPMRDNDYVDLIIANKEFGVNIANGPPNRHHYIVFMNADPGMPRSNTPLGLAQGQAGPIPVNNEDVTDLDIHNFYNNYVVARNVDNMNFFDEVNVVHYIHKLLARKNIMTVRELQGPIYDRIVMVNIPNQGPSTLSRLNRGGNLEGGGAGVKSWGAYANDNTHSEAFISLRTILRGEAAALVEPQRQLAAVFRDLYRLECIREPAALITNAMFVDLAILNANAGYTSINTEVYNFGHIIDRMPMAPVGTVQAVRRLWALLIAANNAIGQPNAIINPNIIENPIYYRYDYPSLAGFAVIPNGAVAAAPLLRLTRLENNLLFNYIMHKADTLYAVNGNVVGNGNITNRLRTQVLIPGAIVQQQQNALVAQIQFVQLPLAAQGLFPPGAPFAVGAVNPWQLVAGAVPAAGAPLPIPALPGGVLPDGVVSIYQLTVPIRLPEIQTLAGEVLLPPSNHNITFQARFRANGNPLTNTDIYITSFPLALINHLLCDWYRVNIELPNINIDIDLHLR